MWFIITDYYWLKSDLPITPSDTWSYKWLTSQSFFIWNSCGYFNWTKTYTGTICVRVFLSFYRWHVLVWPCVVPAHFPVHRRRWDCLSMCGHWVDLVFSAPVSTVQHAVTASAVCRSGTGTRSGCAGNSHSIKMCRALTLDQDASGTDTRSGCVRNRHTECTTIHEHSTTRLTTSGYNAGYRLFDFILMLILFKLWNWVCF